MSRRLDIERHASQLEDLRKILDSMKALAYMETRRLAQFIDAQQQTVRMIESVAADFMHFHPAPMAVDPAARRCYLLIGSERGFCGDFNHAVLRALPQDATAIVIAVGQKLHAALPDLPNPVRLLNGAGSSDEVAAVMVAIVDMLSGLQQQYGSFTLDAIFAGDKDVGIGRTALLPPRLPAASRGASAPQLQLSPREMARKLIDRYVFAALNEMLYSSLMAENSRRVQHLSGAVRHLQERCAALKREGNALRQEEITEEIEVILLGVEIDSHFMSQDGNNNAVPDKGV